MTILSTIMAYGTKVIMAGILLYMFWQIGMIFYDWYKKSMGTQQPTKPQQPQEQPKEEKKQTGQDLKQPSDPEIRDLGVCNYCPNPAICKISINDKDWYLCFPCVIDNKERLNIKDEDIEKLRMRR